MLSKHLCTNRQWSRPQKLSAANEKNKSSSLSFEIRRYSTPLQSWTNPLVPCYNTPTVWRNLIRSGLHWWAKIKKWFFLGKNKPNYCKCDGVSLHVYGCIPSNAILINLKNNQFFTFRQCSWGGKLQPVQNSNTAQIMEHYLLQIVRP